MDSKLIQKMAQVGSKIEVTLATGNQISGLLTEISLDHITIDRKMAISVEAVVAVQNIDDINVQGSPSSPPTLDNKVDTPSSLGSNPNKIEAPEHNKLPPSEEVASDPPDVSTESVNAIPGVIAPSESSEVEIESIDSVPKQTAISDAVDTNTELGTSNLEKQASEKLTEIEDRFSIQIQSATTTIGLAPLDLTFPAKELKDWQNIQGVYPKWNQIKDYEDSQKTGELDSKSDSILSIIADLKFLIARFPDSPALKRTLAHFYSLSGNWAEALRNYQALAIQSEITDDWCDVAVCALVLNDEKLACYSLWKYFQEVSIIDEENELKIWYAYVGLLEKFKSLPAFRARCRRDDIKDDKIEVLFDTAVYLLKKTSTEALATEIIQKRLIGESAECLLVEACQKLDSQPVKSYLQFFTEFNDLIALEKKTTTKTPKPSKHTNAVKRPAYQSTQQKQRRHTHSASGGKGHYLYRQAERANTIDKDLEEAERLYGECMEKGIQFESALKDRAMVLARLERYEKAEDLLLLEDNRQKVKDKQSVDRLLINIYQKWGQYQKAIDLLNDLLNQTQDIEKSTDIQWQIASIYLKLEDYVNAETKFRQVHEQRPENITVKHNIAICLLKQRRPRYNKAEEILNEIQNTSPDVKTAKLLEDLQRARTTGEFSLNEDNSKEFLSDFSFSGDASEFAKFFLKRCIFKGLRAQQRIIDGKYEPPSQSIAETDIEDLIEAAEHPNSAGPTRPDVRAPLYLSAAKICDMGFGDRNDFYRYLCSSFASGGDLALTENLDTAQAWYREALITYDKTMLSNLAKDVEIDAKGSLVRYLYAIELPSNKIPMPPSVPSIAEAVKNVIEHCTERAKVFDAIAYLISHSQYANQQILKVLYEDSNLQREAIAYLQKMGIPTSTSIDSQVVFTQLWKDLEDKNDEKVREISNDLSFLNSFELSQAWLEDSIRSAQNLHAKLLFELDESRIGELQRILKTALDLCGRTVYEDRRDLCNNLKNDCQDLLEEIEKNPTNLSIKYVYSIIEIIQEKVNIYFEELYKSSKPNVELRLADGTNFRVPDDNGTMEVQIVVANEEGRMPAESLKLVTQLEAALLREEVSDIELEEPLRGGKEAQKILRVPLHLTEYAEDEQAFSLGVRAEYRIPGGEKDEIEVNLAISLGSKDEFETIDNPYAQYAGGQEVDDENMFKGRRELIDNIADAIQQSGSQSKCVLVYGQYRSGKSSVRLHLQKQLEEENLTKRLKGEENLLVVDLGNIDSSLDQDSQKPISYQILRGILRSLESTVKTQLDTRSLSFSIPNDTDFYNHDTPLSYFEETFKELKQTFRQNWGIVQIVLLIDEFQYIYDTMVTTHKLNNTFMRTWKGFLQKNLFSAVLVGQQVMAKFHERFPNEFASIQHEKVTYLNESDAQELIVEPILIGGTGGESRYKERAVEQILKLTASSPFYIQIICNRLVNLMNIRRTEWVTEADVQSVAEGLIEEYSTANFQNFTSAGDESPEAIPESDTLEVLKAIADNTRTGTCHRNSINCRTHLEIDKILNDLVSRDVVRTQGEYYEIRVGLFKEWLIRQV